MQTMLQPDHRKKVEIFRLDKSITFYLDVSHRPSEYPTDNVCNSQCLVDHLNVEERPRLGSEVSECPPEKHVYITKLHGNEWGFFYVHIVWKAWTCNHSTLAPRIDPYLPWFSHALPVKEETDTTYWSHTDKHMNQDVTINPKLSLVTSWDF